MSIGMVLSEKFWSVPHGTSKVLGHSKTGLRNVQYDGHDVVYSAAYNSYTSYDAEDPNTRIQAWMSNIGKYACCHNALMAIVDELLTYIGTFEEYSSWPNKFVSISYCETSYR